MSLGDRIERRRIELGLSQSEVARRAGLRQSTFASILKSPSQTSKHIHAIAQALQTSTTFLAGETDDPSFGALPAPTADMVAEQLDAVRVPHLSLSYAMGGGVLIEEPVVLGHFAVPREWLRGRIAGRIEDVAFIMGEGESMFPTIKDGDMLMIDRAQRTVRQQDQIFALVKHDVGMVKRLRRTRDGYEILSDNPSVPPDRADDGEMTIVGRVIWVGSWK
ncbi:XRE family transcriptional regulator [Sphingomonas sp. PR090111-T3T-6A]|uniref:XRE family transcriptional regulator n=1 Tax=Sphingomonas sp. PR090111-T3T-6A TaxID=685778 RepID=UPI0009FF3993|nr:S24 family peptidase [Sphingomonas sp. PR090111-T3T-6A]